MWAAEPSNISEASDPLPNCPFRFKSTSDDEGDTSSSSSSRDDKGSDGGTIWTSTNEVPIKPEPAEAAGTGAHPAADSTGGLAPEVAEAAGAAGEGGSDPVPEPAAAAAAAAPVGVPARRGLQHTASLDHYLQVGPPAQAMTVIFVLKKCPPSVAVYMFTRVRCTVLGSLQCSSAARPPALHLLMLLRRCIQVTQPGTCNAARMLPPSLPAVTPSAGALRHLLDTPAGARAAQMLPPRLLATDFCLGISRSQGSPGAAVQHAASLAPYLVLLLLRHSQLGIFRTTQALPLSLFAADFC